MNEIAFPSGVTNSISSTLFPAVKVYYWKLYFCGSDPNKIVLAPEFARKIFIRIFVAGSSGVITFSHWTS